MIKLTAALIMSVLFVSSFANADEPIENAEVLELQGFREVVPLSPFLLKTSLVPAHSLQWPIDFQDETHVIGNTMAQFQPYETTYWHGGCDLRVKAGAQITAPIAGRIEAGHYSYATNPDGSMTKYFKPWPAMGDETYFEVAVVADDGTRYEFHHVDRDLMPQTVIRLIEKKGRVASGDVLGFALTWPDGIYHHVHYNVIAPNGVRINPEYVSPLLPDSVPPKVETAFAVTATGQTLDFGNGTFLQPPAEFVVAVYDKQNANIYSHPPTWARLIFANGAETYWDFRQTLTMNDGVSFPSLYTFFRKSLKTPAGGILSTTGGYGTGVSLVRLSVPPGAFGEYRIELGDQSDNVTSLIGKVGF